MARIRIFVTQVRRQHGVKTFYIDVLRQNVVSFTHITLLTDMDV